MKQQFVVFWFPTIFHDTLLPKKIEIVNKESEDGFFDVGDEGPCPYLVKLRLVNERDIIVFSRVTTQEGAKPEEFETILTLDDSQKRRNGFMQFSFDEDKVPENCRIPFKGNLTNPIYHKIKEFYHEHECLTEKDSDLVPIITDAPLPLETDNNPALLRFLTQFSDLFRSNAEHVSLKNKEARELYIEIEFLESMLSNISEKDKQELQHWKCIFLSILKDIDAYCENASIEYTYCKTLLSSIYNISFKHDVLLNKTDQDIETKKDYRRQALNIRNSIRYIENIKYKNMNRRLDLLRISNEQIKSIIVSVDQSLERGDKWQRIGITLAIYSALSALLFGFQDKICTTFFNVSLFMLSVLLILFMFIDVPKRFKRGINLILDKIS